MITEQKVKSFLLLSKELNFSRTAQQLYISQQALSAQILALENDLGYPLFVRTTKSVHLTEAGEKMADFFQRAEAELQTLSSTFRCTTSTLMRIGCFENLDLGSLLFQARDTMPADYSGLSCQLSISANYSGLLEKLDERSIDLAVMPLGIELPARFRTQVMAADVTYAFFSDRFPNCDQIHDLMDLKDALMFAGPERNKLWRCLHSYFHRRGVQAKLSYDPGISIFTERMLIESGEGVGFGGQYSFLYRNSKLKRFPLEISNEIGGEIGAVWRKDNSNPLIREYVKNLKAQF